MRKLSSQEQALVVWGNLLDLGLEASLAWLRKNKDEPIALEELRQSLRRQSDEHWEAIVRLGQRLP